MHTMTIEQYVRQITGVRFAKIPVDGKSRSFRDSAKRTWYVLGYDDLRLLWNRQEVHSLSGGEASVLEMISTSDAIRSVSASLLMLTQGEPKDEARGKRMSERYLPAAIEAATSAGIFQTVEFHGE